MCTLCRDECATVLLILSLGSGNECLIYLLKSTEVGYVTCYTWFALERLCGLGLSLASSLTNGCQSIFVLRHMMITFILLPVLLRSARSEES